MESVLTLILGFIGVVGINAVIVAFSYGKITNKISTAIRDIGKQEMRIDADRKQSHNDRERDQKQFRDDMKGMSHQLLPECSQLFQSLQNGQSNLEGKVDTLIRMVKNGDRFKGG